MALGDGIRRNIASVEPAERALLREALIELNNRHFPGSKTDSPPGGVSLWFKQDEIHQATHVHGGPEFLPWHRELVNRFEGMLRQVNPQLSLHYWDWTQDPRNIPNANLGGGITGALNLFTPDFMGHGGSTSDSVGEPWLSADYYVPGATPHRNSPGNNAAFPPRDVVRQVSGSPATQAQDDNVLDAGDFAVMRVRLESVHNGMHGFVNMGGAHTSFRDPFVFLLHSNVDRLFTRWQTDPAHPERLSPNTFYGTETGNPGINSNIDPWSTGHSEDQFGVKHTTRPWSAPENQGIPKTYKHPTVVAPPAYDTNHPIVTIPLTLEQGTYTIQQMSNGRFVDAHQSEGNDFSLVTRALQNNDTQRWILKPLGDGSYTIQQKSNGRFVDAHESSGNDFSLVSRPAQNNDTQRWILKPLGNNTYTIQQKSNGRFVDAHESAGNDFSLVTRPVQNNDTQRWSFTSVIETLYTIQQKSNDRFVDAHESAGNDFSLVTRAAQNNDTQRWILTPVGGIYTIQQKSNGRFVDAHQNEGKDFSLVTRTGQKNDTQRWILMYLGDGSYTIQQKSNGRFVDAHESSGNDFSLVTRAAQNNDTQRWILASLGNNTYTMQQKSNGRFVDAHESSGNDFSLVTRSAQNNDTQRWILTPVGGGFTIYTIQQKSNGRFVDAHESSVNDFSLVTRAVQNNASQRWILTPSPFLENRVRVLGAPLDDDTYTMQQKSNDRFVDAHESSGNDFSLVTRTAQNNDTQRWVIKSL